METFSEDLDYARNKIGMPIEKSSMMSNHRKGGHSSQFTDDFYRKVSRRQIVKLYHYYKDDFLLFDYNLDGYL